MSERKILPCPFCGEKAKTFHIPENDEEEMKKHPKWKWNNPGMWVIGCDTNYMCIGNINHFGTLFLTEEDAIKTWNTRKPMEKVVEQLEDLKCKYRKIMTSIPTGCTDKCSDYGCSECAIENAIEIVKQVSVETDDVCEWKYNGNEYLWETSCGNLHIFMSDGPNENKYQYCPYCGKEILARSDS